LLGSCCIINEILFLDRRKLRRVYHRMLLVISIYDVIESIFNFQSSWPIPADTPNIAFNVGKSPSNGWCEAQGFVLQAGLALVILNMCLAVYYLLVIRFSWSEVQIRKRAEPIFHIVALGCALATASLGIKHDLYNNSNLWCWYAPYPADCKDSFTYGDEANCIRGDNAWLYRWFAYYLPLWLCILTVMVVMGSVYSSVHGLEKANSRFLQQSLGSNLVRTARSGSPSKSRRVAQQALWYVGAFYLTFLFATINRLVQQIVNKTYFPLIVCHAIFEPGQGFFNYLVYLRPRFLRYRERHPNATFFQIVRMMSSRDPSRIGVSHAHSGTYVDQDHEDEEACRQEVARWRRFLTRRGPSFRRRSQRHMPPSRRPSTRVTQQPSHGEEESSGEMDLTPVDDDSNERHSCEEGGYGMGQELAVADPDEANATESVHSQQDSTHVSHTQHPPIANQ